MLMAVDAYDLEGPARPVRRCRRTPGAGFSGATSSRRFSGPRPRRTSSSASSWWAWTSATGRRYLFRVVDVSYGTEHREPGWAERVAGTLLADDARGESGAHSLHEQAKRTYRLAECRCLGYLAPPEVPGDQRTVFRKPKSLPTQFSRVVSPAPEDFAFLAGAWETCPSATCAAARPSSSSPSASPAGAWPATSGIFATTGMGKSNLLQVLCAGSNGGQRPLRLSRHRPSR